MNAITQLIPAELTEALGWTFFHSLWQFALIALLLGLVLSLLGKFSSQFRYFLASSGYVFILTVAIYTFVTHYESGSEAAFAKAPVQNAQISAQTEVPTESINSGNASSTGQESFFKTWYAEIKSFLSNQFPILVLIWILGVFILSLRFFGNLAYVHRLKHYRTIEVDQQWHDWLNTMKDRLGITKPVRIVKSTLINSPLVVGIFKPVILLPLSTFSGVPVREMECIIAHEIAHIKRHDYLVNLLQKMVEILFFYHPAVWWMSSVIKSERENCCDDIAITLTGDSVNFVKALANMEEQRQVAGLAVAFSGNKNKLLKRIQRLLNQRKMKSNFMEGFIASCVIFLGLIALAFTFSTEPHGKTLHGSNQTQNDVTVGDTNSYNVLKSLEQPDSAISADLPAQPAGNPPAPKAPEEIEEEEMKYAQERQEEAQKEQEEQHKTVIVTRSERQRALDEKYEHEREQTMHHHDVEIIVQEALRAANEALAEINVDVEINRALQEAERELKEAEIERAIEEAMREVQANMNEIDIHAIIQEAMKAAREASEDIDMEEIMLDIEEAMNDIDIEMHAHKLKEINKHKEIIDRGVTEWNRWRDEHPDIMPNLVGVNLSEANLEGANLENAKLMGADLKEANLKNAILTGAKLQGANLKEATLEGTVFTGAELTGADLKEVDLTGKDLRGIRLIGANLKEASLKRADLREADLRGVNIKEANLTGADLRETDLRGANLSEADIRGADFRDAKANRNTLFPTDFDTGKEEVDMDY
jgi:beta-lactamase regulating signal transducer with metallopeptidase domain